MQITEKRKRIAEEFHLFQVEEEARKLAMDAKIEAQMKKDKAEKANPFGSAIKEKTMLSPVEPTVRK